MTVIINACLGVLYDPNFNFDRVLLASRPKGKVLAGHWEFPGGKLEGNETAYIALARELKEEINIEAKTSAMHTIGYVEHQYPHGLAKLEVILVLQWHGELIPLEGQQLLWYKLDGSLPVSPLLPTTAKIFKLLKKIDSN